MPINTAPNSPFKGYYPNVNPFGISPRYNPSGLISYLNKQNEDDITTSIKPVDKSVANIEAEKGEILSSFTPVGVGFHKITGKKHSQGGTPLNVPDGSFIFSNDKQMALTREEVDTFKLGKYQKGGLHNNTPAKIFNRTIDITHNNKMIHYLNNSKNYAEKNTARLMADKYQQKAGTIAALQEIRKPDGNMPAYGNLEPQDHTTERIAKQYSYGGWVKGLSGRNMQDWGANAYDQQMGEAQQKFDWIPEYDWTPKLLSMAGNLMQMPKSYTPALALQSGYQVHGQEIDPQQGINAALSQAYASRKANDQFATNNTARNQFNDTQFSGQAMDFANQVNKQNQSVQTNVANQNAEIQNQVLNNNNSQRAAYADKLNEMYQNVDDSRRQIGATNLNLLGQGYQEQKQYDFTVKGLKEQYAWDVRNKMNTPTLSSQMNQVNELLQNNPSLQQHPIILNAIMKQMFQTKQQPSTQEDYLKRLMDIYGQ